MKESFPQHREVRTKLLKEYGVDEKGIWIIYGEDPNADFGGYHHEPRLDIVEGQYRDVVDYALTLRNFFSWGGGGRIEKIQAKKIDSVSTKKRQELQAEKNKLQKLMEQIDKEIKEI